MATDFNQMDLRTAKRDVAFSKDFVEMVDYAAYDAGRKFFMTESGYLGLGPKDTRKGIVVFVFLSFGFPIMLRQIHRRDANEMLGTFYGKLSSNLWLHTQLTLRSTRNNGW